MHYCIVVGNVCRTSPCPRDGALLADSISSPALAWLLWTIFLFVTGDGDLSLLKKAKPPPLAFKDKVVWITGASQGIGEELAHHFCRLGAKLILSSRRISELERVKASLRGDNAPHNVVVLPLDVTADETSISEVIEKAESAFDGNGIDIMVHNAAGPRNVSGFLDISEEVMQASFSVNVLGTIRLTKLLAPKMIKRGHGQFVVLSSIAGKVAAPHRSIYSATKFALHGYFNCLRHEIGRTGIKVTIICPGPIATVNQGYRQPLGRCVELILRAVYHEMEEAWITFQPILCATYLQQYCPSIASYILEIVGNKKQDSYTVSAILKRINKQAVS